MENSEENLETRRRKKVLLIAFNEERNRWANHRGRDRITLKSGIMTKFRMQRVGKERWKDIPKFGAGRVKLKAQIGGVSGKNQNKNCQ